MSELPVEPISLNYAKINWKFTPVGESQFKLAQPLTGQSDREQLREHLAQVLLMNSQSAANQQQAGNISDQRGKNLNQIAGRMFTKRIRNQDNRSFRGAGMAIGSDVNHQLQSALLSLGMTFAGARQVISGHTVNSKVDRQLLREILILNCC